MGSQGSKHSTCAFSCSVLMQLVIVWQAGHTAHTQFSVPVFCTVAWNTPGICNGHRGYISIFTCLIYLYARQFRWQGRMVNKAEGSLDETILQIFEEQEESFYWPVRSQKDARAFVKALNVKGVKYEDVCSEIEEFSSNFTAWRKGLGRIGIGNRVIERINRPLQEVLESDDEDDVMEKVKKFKAKQANGGGQKPPSPELEARLHSTKAEVTKEQKKGIEDSWMKNIEKKTESLKKDGDANGNAEKVASSSTTRASSTSSSSAASSSGSQSGSSSGTSSSSSSVEREIKPQLRSSEERTESVLRKMENRNSWVEREKEAAVFARTVALKDEKSSKAVVEQANMKPSDILKRQSPNRSVSPASEKSATPSREQSPLVERSNIPQTKTLETKSEPKVQKKVEESKKQETSKPVETSKVAKEEAAKVEKIDDKKVVEEKRAQSPKPSKLGVAPRADTESLSSSSSSSSSSEDEEEDEEEEEKPEKKMEKEEEEEEETESSSTEESSEEEEEESEDEKAEDEKAEKAVEESKEEEVKEEVSVAPVPTKAEKEEEEEEDDDDDEESESGSGSESESEDELITENYDSDLDKEAGDSSSEFKSTHKYINQLKEQDDDGPGYIYVFTDSPRDATHHRVKVNASRFPEKRLEQAQKFNLDMRTESAVPVRDRKAAVKEVHNALEKYRMDRQRDWFYGLPDKMKAQVLKVCEKYVSEASDC